MSLRDTVRYHTLLERQSPATVTESSQLIYDALLDDKPRLISRFGSTELRTILRYRNRMTRSVPEKTFALATRLEAPVWTYWEHRNIKRKSGFFPVDKRSIADFYHLMIESMPDVDILGSWVPGEDRFAEELQGARAIPLEGLSPFGTDAPWTHALEGKRVLVIHPFEDSIRAQFKKRSVLFPSGNLMPNFELLTLKAVQSLGTPPPDFGTWFEALEWMSARAQTKDFDIALIACGAYGFPLGARIRKAGKTALVVGGILQLLFGIRGKRWDSLKLDNEHWISPSTSEKPDGFKGADGGAYW